LDTQEFWKGDFGNDYTERNVGLEENNYHMFKKIFLNHDENNYPIERSNDIKSIIEFGAGSGQNIKALKRIFPDAKITAVEINEKASQYMADYGIYPVFNESILSYRNKIDTVTTKKHELVLTKGVLIHIPPEELIETYRALYHCSNKYILICEYYNPVEIEIPYRGNSGKMWKRDFAGDMMDMFPDLILLDYGFCYNRPSESNKYIQDSITWFLLKK
jgi:spore coat polysaccharide biosynthesis protein SpsF